MSAYKSGFRMNIKRCDSPNCDRPYQVNKFTTILSETYKLGVIKCPHCGTSTKGSPDSLFLTHALSPEEEARFNSEPETNQEFDTNSQKIKTA